MTFQKINISGWQFEIYDDFPAGFPAGITDTFRNGLRSDFAKLPSSEFANVFKFNLLFKGRVHNLILKQYLNRSPLEIFKNLLFSCRAYRAFNADLMLKQHGFAVPDVVAIGKKTFIGFSLLSFPRKRESRFFNNFLITAEITDSMPLHEILETNNTQRQQIITQFGQMVGRMHAENIFHGDLRFGNILVKQEKDKFIFFLLDNERTKKFEKLPLRLRLKNLVQIWISRTTADEAERNCFLDAYLSQQNVKIDREKLTAQIAARVKKRLASKNLSH